MKVANGGRSAANGKTRIYIGRGTAYGNPYRLGVDGDRATVIAKYKAWFDANPALQKLCLSYLKGKTLVCHCAPLACHGDVIAAFVKQHEEPESKPEQASLII